jgi:hypothetical protein
VASSLSEELWVVRSNPAIKLVAYFLVSPVGFKHRNKVPASFRLPVEVFLPFQSFLASNTLLALLRLPSDALVGGLLRKPSQSLGTTRHGQSNPFLYIKSKPPVAGLPDFSLHNRPKRGNYISKCH